MAEGGDGVAGGGDSVVTEECLQELLDFFVKSAYRAKTVDRHVSTVYPMNNAVNMQGNVRVSAVKSGRNNKYHPPILCLEVEAVYEVSPSGSYFLI